MSTPPFSITDQLLVYDDDTPVINKSASATYYFYDGHWTLFGDDFDAVQGDALNFTPCTGVIIRKSGERSTTEKTIYWTHDVPTSNKFLTNN